MKRLFSALVLATSVSTAAADEGLEGFEIMATEFAAADGCGIYVDTNLWGNGRSVNPEVTVTREVCSGTIVGYPVFDPFTTKRLAKIKNREAPVAVHGGNAIERDGNNFIIWSGRKGKVATITPTKVRKALGIKTGFRNPQLLYGNSVGFPEDVFPLVFRYTSTDTNMFVDKLVAISLKKKGKVLGAIE